MTSFYRATAPKGVGNGAQLITCNHSDATERMLRLGTIVSWHPSEAESSIVQIHAHGREVRVHSSSYTRRHVSDAIVAPSLRANHRCCFSVSFYLHSIGMAFQSPVCGGGAFCYHLKPKNPPAPEPTLAMSAAARAHIRLAVCVLVLFLFCFLLLPSCCLAWA